MLTFSVKAGKTLLIDFLHKLLQFEPFNYTNSILDNGTYLGIISNLKELVEASTKVLLG